MEGCTEMEKEGNIHTKGGGRVYLCCLMVNGINKALYVFGLALWVGLQYIKKKKTLGFDPINCRNGFF